jgi:hypothetical protein
MRLHMSLIAAQFMSDADDGKQHPELVFAVFHVAEMLRDLKAHYYASYSGERHTP